MLRFFRHSFWQDDVKSSILLLFLLNECNLLRAVVSNFLHTQGGVQLQPQDAFAVRKSRECQGCGAGKIRIITDCCIYGVVSDMNGQLSFAGACRPVLPFRCTMRQIPNACFVIPLNLEKYRYFFWRKIRYCTVRFQEKA